MPDNQSLGLSPTPGKCCCCPACASGALDCDYCGDTIDTGSSFSIRFNGWTNNSCSVCENRNCTVICPYADNDDGGAADCACRYTGSVDPWPTSNHDLTTHPDCIDSILTVNWRIHYLTPEVFGGNCATLLRLVIGNAHGFGGTRQVFLVGKKLPCNFFDSEVDFQALVDGAGAFGSGSFEDDSCACSCAGNHLVPCDFTDIAKPGIFIKRL